MTRHTQGPWRTIQRDDHEIVVYGDAVGAIARVTMPDGDANARLIAAAPELLKFVVSLSGLTSAVGDEARALLARINDSKE